MPQKKTEDKISDDVTNGTSKAGISRRKRSVKAKMANFETQDDVTKDPTKGAIKFIYISTYLHKYYINIIILK